MTQIHLMSSQRESRGLLYFVIGFRHSRQMFVFLTIILCSVVKGQLTVEDWFFPVSVAPPDSRDNSVYDEVVNNIPETETFNITHKEIKEYYENDKWEKWNNQKPNLKPVLKTFDQFENYNDANANRNPSQVPPIRPMIFLPNSGVENKEVPKFAIKPADVMAEMKEEPVISMSMTPISHIEQPSEITNRSQEKVTEVNEISMTTNEVTTRLPYIYAITKNSENAEVVGEKNQEMVKIKKDVFRLRNEMNLVKALLNKLYRKSYKKQKDYISKHSHDVTRLSAFQKHIQDFNRR